MKVDVKNSMTIIPYSVVILWGLFLLASTSPPPKCIEPDLLCGGTCVNQTSQCDGIYDCLKREDEAVSLCGCPAGEFACPDKCIPEVKRCDRSCDCGDDNSTSACLDETTQCESFHCHVTHFKCDNHKCVLKSQLCNFVDDCGDNSDERTCHHENCDKLFHFTCNNMQCVPLLGLCDGHMDCYDESDEQVCGKENLTDCGNGRFVHVESACNAKDDCASGADEKNCTSCRMKGMTLCPKEGRCFDYNPFCNNFCECEDCEDEQDCPGEPCDATNGLICPFALSSKTNPGEMVYRLTGCVKSDRICDDEYDCANYVDEYACATNGTCDTIGSEPCSGDDQRCLPPFVFCDGIKQCSNGTDESECAVQQRCGKDQFQCGVGTCIHESRVCDGEFHCSDFTDEQNCVDMVDICPTGTFQCTLTGQCLNSVQRCNKKNDCIFINGTIDTSDEDNCEMRKCSSKDEFQCQNGVCIPSWRRCFKDVDDELYGCQDKSHLWNCSASQCTLPEQYKCLRHFCLTKELYCKGGIDCPLMDDTEGCPHICRGDSYPSCICNGSMYHCNNASVTDINFWYLKEDSISWAEFRHNRISIENLLVSAQNESALVIQHLDLSSNNITDLLSFVFQYLYNLKTLILMDNRITEIRKNAFYGLINLKELNLQENFISIIYDGSFTGLSSITTLNLSHQHLSVIEPKGFNGMSSLHFLNISYNNIGRLPNGIFYGVDNLQTIDLYGNNMDVIEDKAFNGLLGLEVLITSQFRFCCAARHIEGLDCSPKPDEFSSCEDLMHNNFLRMNIWIVGTIGFFGNGIVIIWRASNRHDNKVQSFLITNLAVGDMLMGIYLLIIACTDFFLRGRYALNEVMWKASGLCKFCGFLSTFSSELSVFSLTFITLHRLSSIVFPFRTKDMDFRRIVWIMALAWSIVITLALIPLLGFEYFDNFYGRSGVCLALHITPDKPSGWEYAVFVFLALNFVSFSFIALSYVIMFRVARRTQQQAKRSVKQNSGGDSMARKMTLIVFTDFICWMPIILLGLSSLAGASIPPQVFAWIAVFILPLNSAINPLLYTLWTAPYARRFLSRARESIIMSYSTVTTEYKIGSNNLSPAQKRSNNVNSRRSRPKDNTPKEIKPLAGTVYSNDVIHEPEETISLTVISDTKSNLYTNPYHTCSDVDDDKTKMADHHKAVDLHSSDEE